MSHAGPFSWTDVMSRLRPRSSTLIGNAPPEVPASLRLYPDSSCLKWKSDQILIRQRSFETRSPLVHILLEQLQLLIDFAAHHDGQPSPFQVNDLAFTLDASAEIVDNVRKYRFECSYPVKGEVILEERLEYGRHSWKHFMEIAGKTISIRDITEPVKKYTESQRSFRNGRLILIHEEFERQLDI